MAATFQLVDRDEVLARELARVDEPVIGIDVERADSQQYFRYPALIQIGSASDCVLIDSLQVQAFRPVNEFVASRTTVVLHAGENDREPLTAKGIVLGTCEDTAVAAGLLGLPIGLGTLLHDLLDIETPDKNRFQRADWAKRPLSDAMLAYAASDVIHLPRLWETLRHALMTAGRFDWYLEERERVNQRALNRSRSVKKLRGAGGLNPQERAVLNVLWQARETHAREHDLAPNFLLHDDVLLRLARSQPDTLQALQKTLPGRKVTRTFAPELFEALKIGQASPPEIRDPSRVVIDDKVHDALKQARSTVAKDLGLDAGMLAPAGALRHALSAPVESGEDLLIKAGLDGWRTPLLADVLWDAYTAAMTSEPAVFVPDSPAN